MSAKTTPGPWRVQQDRHRPQVFHVFGPSEIVSGLDGICSPHRANDRSFKEDEANMWLIAAAPDLLEALRDLIDDLELRSTKGVVNCSHGVYCTARQAIAKAEGRS